MNEGLPINKTPVIVIPAFIICIKPNGSRRRMNANKLTKTGAVNRRQKASLSAIRRYDVNRQANDIVPNVHLIYSFNYFYFKHICSMI